MMVSASLSNADFEIATTIDSMAQIPAAMRK